MKLVIFIFALLTTLLILDNQAWSAPITDTHNKALLRQIRDITKKCVVADHAADGQTVVAYHSQCAIFTIDSQEESHVFTQGEWLTVRIAPSVDADGGDLALLVIEDHNGRLLAQKDDVLAFGNVISAMAGQDLN